MAFKLMRKSETYPTRLMYSAGRHNISSVRGTGTINAHSLNRGAHRVPNGNRSGSNPSEKSLGLRPRESRDQCFGTGPAVVFYLMTLLNAKFT